jgi:hypothetical protein
MSNLPWGVIIVLGSGLIFTAYVIYYILRLAYLEMQNETSESDSINHKSHH